MSPDAQRMHNRWMQRKAQGRCPKCGEKLLPECETILCRTCNDRQNAGRGGGGVKAEMRARVEHEVQTIVETAETHTLEQQAALLGVSLERVYAIRAAARRRGHPISREHAKTGGFNGPRSPKWAELDKAMATSCPRCGLRGSHECVQLRADDRRSA